MEAGADVIAFDGTMRERPNGAKLEELIKYIKINNSGRNKNRKEDV